MDGPEQLKPLRILVALFIVTPVFIVTPMVGPFALAQADQTEKQTQARAAAQACAFLAETARNIHQPFVARLLADAGIHLLQAEREIVARDVRLKARLRLLRDQSQVEEAAVWRMRAERYLQGNETAEAQVLLERAVEQLESCAAPSGSQQGAHRRNVALALCYLALGQLSESRQPDEAQRCFAAACDLFATQAARRWHQRFDPATVDARRVALICNTRLAEHLFRTGDPNGAVEKLRHAKAMVIPTADRADRHRAVGPSAALANPIARVPRRLLLPLARSLHLQAMVQSDVNPQQAMSRFDEAVACYEAALCQGVGDQVDLAICHLDHAAVLVDHQSVEAARDRVATASTLLYDAADGDRRAWLPLSTAYAQLAQLDTRQTGAPNCDYLDQAVGAARQAVGQDQPAARHQLADLLLERGLAVLDTAADHAAARRDLEQAAREYGRVRSKTAEITSDGDRELLWAELICQRALAKLEWIDGEALESVCRRWQQARQILEAVREESGPWYAEAARLEGLRAELIAWSCAQGEPRGHTTLVPTSDALPGPTPTTDEQQPQPTVPPNPAAAVAYEIAHRHYEAAHRLEVAVADEWDVLLFNAADYCENFLGDARQALRYFEQELALQDHVSGSPALCAGNRALICARMGLIESRLLARPDRAAELYQQALGHRERNSIDDHQLTSEREVAIQAELSLGLLGAQLPEFQQAAGDHFVAALRMLGDIEEPTERELSFEYWAHHGLARQLRRAGNEAQARQHTERAAALAAQLGFTEPEAGTPERRVVE